MPRLFNEAKTTQAAAHLLRLNGGSMRWTRLIDLLYLADRCALLRWGRTITKDRYISAAWGPALENVRSLICDQPEDAKSIWWLRYILKEGDYVRLLKYPGDGEMSRAETDLLAELLGKCQFPEWRDPGIAGEMTDISLADILRAAGRSEAEIADLEAEIASVDWVHDNCGVPPET
jgi:hypothetical protein